MLSAIRSNHILLFLSIFIFLTFLKTNNDSSTLIEWQILSVNSFHVELPIILDPQGLIFASTVLFISSNVMTFASNYMSEDLDFKRFTLLVILFVLSMNFLIFIPNLSCLLLGWDGLGLISFLLVIYYKNHKSCGAGLITAFTNRLGDVFLLVSIALAFNLDSWNIFAINSSYSTSLLWLTITVAAMTKSAQMPFSAWLPAAMAAPTPVSALVHSSTLVTAGVFLLIRFSSTLSKSSAFTSFLLTSATITMLMAGMIAMSEMDMKKIIALSTLSQLGVMMFSLALNLPDLAFIHLVTHALFKALLFITAGNLIHWFHHTQDMRAIGNGSPQLPVTATCMLISNLALCAFPFMAGFYSKDMIIEASLSIPLNSLIFTFLTLATALTVLYSIRISSFCLLYLSNQPAPNMSLEKGKNFFSPMIHLALGAIFSGAATSWLFAPLSITPFIPSSIKMCILSLSVISIIIMYSMLSSNSSSSLLPLIKHFLPTMWFMNFISSQLLIKSPLKMSHMTLSSMDQGWNEMYGPQGIHVALKTSSSTSQTWQNNMFYSHLSTPMTFIFFLLVLSL